MLDGIMLKHQTTVVKIPAIASIEGLLLSLAQTLRTCGKIILLSVLTLPVVMGATGCSSHKMKDAAAIGLPEEVYIASCLESYYGPRIIICHFRSPVYDGQAGAAASMSLYKAMLTRGLKADLFLAEAVLPDDTEKLARYMRNSKCDLMITGDVLQYLDGGISTDSQVIQEMKIYTISGNRPHIAGYAKAVASDSPKTWKDYIFVQKEAQSALCPERLLQQNSAKFARLLEKMFSCAGAHTEKTD